MGCYRSYQAQLETVTSGAAQTTEGTYNSKKHTLEEVTPILQLSWGRATIIAGYKHFARRKPPHSRGSIWGRLQGSTSGRGSTC